VTSPVVEFVAMGERRYDVGVFQVEVIVPGSCFPIALVIYTTAAQYPENSVLLLEMLQAPPPLPLLI